MTGPDSHPPGLMVGFMAIIKPGDPVVVGFLTDQLIALFAELSDVIKYLSLGWEVIESIETVTDPCQLRTSLTHYAEMFNFNDPGKIGFCVVECNAFVQAITAPFGFGQAGTATNIVRTFFYFACITICDDFATDLTASDRARIRARILTVRNTVQCP